MNPWLMDVSEILIALLLVAVNGFFVAAEFALVKVRGGQITELLQEGRPFSRTARWLHKRLDGALSACQLGITMASLALGWVGEPAFAHLIRPAIHAIGVGSEAALHTIAFVIAFTTITALHLVIGEQAPKIFAIRRPERMIIWCAFPLQIFYILTFPLMVALNWSTARILSLFGIAGAGEHDSPHSEQEIRHLLTQAHQHGSLTGSEHRLLHAVFEFDDMIARRIMVPRNEVEFFDVNDTVETSLSKAKLTKHTRYPVCDGSMDELLGVVHVKDLVGVDGSGEMDIRTIMRPPKKVPESLPISKLLRHFQATHQLMAFVIDEYGIVLGIVTMENVLEQIIGAVDDEFDTAEKNIVPDGPNRWIVQGQTPIDDIVREFELEPVDSESDTFAGMLMHYAGRLLNPGDTIQIESWEARVLEIRDDRVVRVSLKRVTDPANDGEATVSPPGVRGEIKSTE